jgi:PleD family two-component response regulator
MLGDVLIKFIITFVGVVVLKTVIARVLSRIMTNNANTGIEDNRRFSESLVKSLEEDGYAVDAVFDGDSGENMGISYSYDLIVLDIMLPEKNGFEVCRSIALKTM